MSMPFAKPAATYTRESAPPPLRKLARFASGADSTVSTDVGDASEFGSPESDYAIPREAYLPSPAAAALWQAFCFNKDICETASADKSRPCWLVSSQSAGSVAMVQSSEVPTYPAAPPQWLPATSLPVSELEAKKPQLTCTQLSSTNVVITWLVDAKRLRSQDRAVKSQAFALPMAGRSVAFCIMVQPKELPDKKKGTSLAKMRGRGSIHLKCEEDLEEALPAEAAVKFKVTVSKLGQRDEVSHNFRLDGNVARLPPGQCNWNFREAAQEQMVTIQLDVHTC